MPREIVSGQHLRGQLARDNQRGAGSVEASPKGCAEKRNIVPSERERISTTLGCEVSCVASAVVF